MKVYRVSHRRGDGEHTGYEYESCRARALRKQREANLDAHWDDEVETILVDITKKGILVMLNAYASHPDNG